MQALLALFVRSLREDIRSRSTYIVRGALVALVLFFLWTTHSSSSWSGAVGRQFFGSVLWIDLFILSVVGLGYFASSITEEKENETLGLLRMTNLNALSILLGKSTSRLLGALWLLAAQLPFMLVAVTMGGLAVSQVFAGFVCLLGYAFFLGNLGLLCSVLCARTSLSSVLSGISLGTFLFGPYILREMEVGRISEGADQFLWAWRELTPFSRIRQVLDTGFGEPIFDWHLWVLLGAGFAFFLVAWACFDRFADRVGAEPAAVPKPSAQTISTAPGSTAHYFLRRAQLPALRWKDYKFLAGGDTAVAIKGVLTLIILGLCLFALERPTAENAMFSGIMMSTFNLIFLGLCLALDAGRIFKREREYRTLSTLQSLPMSINRIVWDKAIGCLKTSWPPLAGIVLGVVVLAFGSISAGWDFFSGGTFYMLFGSLYAVLATLLLPVIIAWLSLRMRWGALPVGFVVWFFGNQLSALILIAMTREGAIVVLPIEMFALLFFLGGTIPKRLEQLAAEE